VIMTVRRGPAKRSRLGGQEGRIDRSVNIAVRFSIAASTGSIGLRRAPKAAVADARNPYYAAECCTAEYKFLSPALGGLRRPIHADPRICDNDYRSISQTADAISFDTAIDFAAPSLPRAIR
jgi:hypothetical protein